RAPLSVAGLGVAPRARAGGRVARMADGDVPAQRGQVVVVEDVGDEAHVLLDYDPLAVADGHPRRLLAAVLKGVEAVEGEMRDRCARRVDAEDPARLPQLAIGPVVAAGRRHLRPEGVVRGPAHVAHSPISGPGSRRTDRYC